MDPFSMASGAVSLGMNIYSIIQQRKQQKEAEAMAERQQFAINQSADAAELSSFKSSMGGTTMFALGGNSNRNLSFYPGELSLSKGVKLLTGNPHELGGVDKFQMTKTGLHQTEVEAEGGEVELSTDEGNLLISNRLAPADGKYQSYASKAIPVALEHSKYVNSSKLGQLGRNAENRLSKGLKSIYDEQEMQKESMQSIQPQQEMTYGGPDWDPTNLKIKYFSSNSTPVNPWQPFQEFNPSSFRDNETVDNNLLTNYYNSITPANSTNTPNRTSAFMRTGNYSIDNTIHNFTQAGKYAYMIDANNKYYGSTVSDGNKGWTPGLGVDPQTGQAISKAIGKGLTGVGKGIGKVGNSVYTQLSDWYKDSFPEDAQWVPDISAGDYALVGMNTLSQGLSAYAASQAKPIKPPMGKAALINPNYRNDADRSQLNADYSKAMSDLANKGTDLSRMSSTLAALTANKNQAMANLSEDEYNKTLNNHRVNAQMANQVMLNNQQLQAQHLKDIQQHQLQTIGNYSKVASDTFSGIANLRNQQRQIDQINAELDIAASDNNPMIEGYTMMDKYTTVKDYEAWLNTTSYTDKQREHLLEAFKLRTKK